MPGSDTERAGALTPGEARAALGNETRVAILRELWAAPDEELSFSELRHRAGDPDSGQFNYHLGELVGPLVERTEEGYRPVQTGMGVLRTALFGPADDPPTLDAFAVDGACPHCGAGLEASYDGEDALVRCGACGKLQLEEAVPPAAFDGRTPGEAVVAFDRWVLSRSSATIEGVCPDCAGKPETTLFQTRDAQDGSLNYLRARHVCGTCSYECDLPVWLHVLLARHPAVVSFFYDRGIDIGSAPVWEVTGYGADARVTPESEVPLRVVVEFEYDGDALRLTLDDDLNVVGIPQIRATRRVGDD